MAAKQHSPGQPGEVFREFAWHLAGSLAASAAATGRPAGSRRPAGPSRATGKP